MPVYFNLYTVKDEMLIKIAGMLASHINIKSLGI